MLKNLVTNLLREKPRDPVPFIYNFFSQVNNGVQNPVPITNHEVSQIKNLRLKIDDLRSRLGQGAGNHTESEEESEESDGEM